MKKVILLILVILIGTVLYLKFYKIEPFFIENFNQQTRDDTTGILTWSKSDNAIKYEVIIYDEDKKINNFYTEENYLEFNNLNINKGEGIIFDVIAYNRFNQKKHAESEKRVVWELNYKEKVKKIVSTRPSGEIGINRAIRLSTNTEEAKIFYTTDGSDPTTSSKLYTGSIYIDKDMTIKAIAIADNMFNSDVLELTYKAVEKQPAIYLSPSVQEYNTGVSSVGYTNEMEIMNKVSNYIEERLKSNGVIVYRNNNDMTLEEIVDDSSRYDVDMHLAIHSNQYDGKQKGVETWVHNSESKAAIEFANRIQKSLMNIYYDPTGNRGVKYSELVGGMRETNPKKVTSGVLVEIAFHDHYKDAKWIVDSQKQIGHAIADAVISHFNE